MSIALVTGSAGLIGSETSKRFHAEGMEIVGLDNDMRAEFFGPEASTLSTRQRLESLLPRYTHQSIDIRDFEAVKKVFERYGAEIKVIVHTASNNAESHPAFAPRSPYQEDAQKSYS